MLALRPSPEIEARLDALTKKTGRTKRCLACDAIVEDVDDLEDLHLSRARHALIEQGKGKALTLDEAQARLGTRCGPVADGHRREVYRK